MDDVKSSKRLINTWKSIECELCAFANKYSALVFTETIKREATINNHIFGHGCNSNRSLTFIAIDSLKYHYYAESLNINIHNHKDKTAIVIVEDKVIWDKSSIFINYWLFVDGIILCFKRSCY